MLTEHVSTAPPPPRSSQAEQDAVCTPPRRPDHRRFGTCSIVFRPPSLPPPRTLTSAVCVRISMGCPGGCGWHGSPLRVPTRALCAVPGDFGGNLAVGTEEARSAASSNSLPSAPPLRSAMRPRLPDSATQRCDYRRTVWRLTPPANRKALISPKTKREREREGKFASLPSAFVNRTRLLTHGSLALYVVSSQARAFSTSAAAKDGLVRVPPPPPLSFPFAPTPRLPEMNLLGHDDVSAAPRRAWQAQAPLAAYA